ncbi:MAG: hypothetical protein KA444_00830 [Bacteroidia bacterium]|nr:hypothetical protein [Bacteroidia bacterium]
MRKNISAILLLACVFSSTQALGTTPDTTSATSSLSNISFLVVPYKPMMHLSDADYDLAKYSDMNPQQVREQLRLGLLKNLNTKLQIEYDAKIPGQDFVQDDQRDLDMIYSSLVFEQDTVFPLKANAKKDSLQWKKKVFTSKENTVKSLDKTYINVGFYDQLLLPDLSRKYETDYFIFLNELDIKTNFEDCLDLALKIYQRELKVHYSIFDRSGKQVYGDVAVIKFPSNSNDVDVIIASNFPLLSDQILATAKKSVLANQTVIQ